eukprot:GILI01031521.1.p1 GENE.GILI01031521.1~~GILI01031521.1.p1  ORF type:complete len:156 (-),score=18.17 GILI01031521.1:50-517(-)
MLASGLQDDTLDAFLQKAQQLVKKKKVEKRTRAQSQAPVEVCKAAHGLLDAYCDKNKSQREDFFAAHTKRMSALTTHTETLRASKARLIEVVTDSLNNLSESVDVVVTCVTKISERLVQNKQVWDETDVADQKAVLEALQQRIESHQRELSNFMT